ncbi:N-acylneuraminate cytidylyltransferase [Eilatimonas milleporae]|uniref:N-acylneuraminate cytidylyltransferase n=2 Tax=Eilatimonas milleporae TaxID=911205 RepID=A0A3M0C4J9_9PROT|nr:N-acylneuraminate cytidylyltransferase [Eilatimonas milleporae]
MAVHSRTDESAGNNDMPDFSGKTVAFVHAKGTSDRVPGKNMRRLNGKPLIHHALTNALAANKVDHVIIDSDSPDILDYGAALGAVPVKRPATLATNAATGDDLAAYQASVAAQSDICLQVIPTSPFVTPQTIDRGITLIEDSDADSVVGVTSDVFYFWDQEGPAYYRSDGTIPNSIDLPPSIYETTGLYINRTAAVLKSGRRLNPDNARFLMLSRLEAVDINTEEDFALADIISRGMESMTGS